MLGCSRQSNLERLSRPCRVMNLTNRSACGSKSWVGGRRGIPTRTCTELVIARHLVRSGPMGAKVQCDYRSGIRTHIRSGGFGQLALVRKLGPGWVAKQTLLPKEESPGFHIQSSCNKRSYMLLLSHCCCDSLEKIQIGF